MTTIFKIHQIRPPPQHLVPFVTELLSKAGTIYSSGPTIPPDIQVIIGEPTSLDIGEPTSLEMTKYPSLKLLIVPHAGLHIAPDLKKRLDLVYPDLPILTLHHNAVATAEMGMALLLSTAKQIVQSDKEFRGGDWSQWFGSGLPLRQQFVLRGKTVLILGYGRIGRIVAEGCRGMGMQVIGIRSRISSAYTDDLNTTVYPSSELPNLLPTCQVLFSTLPGTNQTEGLVSKKMLQLLPSGSLVVNIGRGLVIQEDALYEELKSKRLAGAGLDVWWSYPPRFDREKQEGWAPSKFDFGGLDNVVMSPHRGGGLHTEEVELQRFKDLDIILETIRKEGWQAIKDHPNLYCADLGY